MAAKVETDEDSHEEWRKRRRPRILVLGEVKGSEAFDRYFPTVDRAQACVHRAGSMTRMGEFEEMLARARALANAAAQQRPADPVYSTLGGALAELAGERNPAKRSESLDALGRWIVRELDSDAILPEDRGIVSAVMRLQVLARGTA